MESCFGILTAPFLVALASRFATGGHTQPTMPLTKAIALDRGDEP